MTGPGSSPGGQSPAAAGSLPVSRQAAGCQLPPGAGRLHGGRGRAGRGDGQQRLGAHGQHGMSAERVPGSDLVLVQACLPLALLVAFFDRPSFPGDRDQARQGHRPALRGMAVEERQVRRAGPAAAEQHPMPRRGGRGPGPRVVAVALAAAPARAGLPRGGRDQPGRRGHGRLRPDGRVTVKFAGTATRYPFLPFWRASRSLPLRP